MAHRLPRHCTSVVPIWVHESDSPSDLHASIRHLECLRDLATLTDKAFHAYSLGRGRNQDALEIARIARGISASQMDAELSRAIFMFAQHGGMSSFSSTRLSRYEIFSSNERFELIRSATIPVKIA